MPLGVVLVACGSGDGSTDEVANDPADTDHKVAVMDDRFDDATLGNLLDQFPDCLATDSVIVRSPTADEVSRAAERGVEARSTVGVDCQSASAKVETLVGACRAGEWLAFFEGAWVEVGATC